MRHLDRVIGRLTEPRPSSTFVGPADRYRLTSVLGRGTMVVVRRGYDRLLERPVAVKLVPGGPDGAGHRRWQRELWLSTTLDHRGVLTVLDGGRLDHLPKEGWFVVTPLGGERLDRLLGDAGPLLVDEVVELGAALAAALGHGHRRGIRHPDLGMRHILLGADGIPRLSGYASLPCTHDSQARQARRTGPEPSDVTRLANVLGACLAPRPSPRWPGSRRTDELVPIVQAMTDRPGAEYDPRQCDRLRVRLSALGSAARRQPRDGGRSQPQRYRHGVFVPRPM